MQFKVIMRDSLEKERWSYDQRSVVKVHLLQPELLRVGAVAARRAHNPEDGGANPSPATN